MKCDIWEDEKDSKQSPKEKGREGWGNEMSYLVRIKLRMRRKEYVGVIYIKT